MSTSSNSDLKKKALLLSYFTVGYNLVEGVVSISAGLIAGSGALIGFGADSFIESLSGSVMIWRFRSGKKLANEEEIEKKAIRLVAVTFFVLGAYVLFESIQSLLQAEKPEPSFIGVVITSLSVLIMPSLAYLKYQTGKKLESKSLIADSKQTLVCVILSVTTLSGLGLNYFFGLWQADSIAGLLIALYLWKEGYEAYRGDVDVI